MNCQNNNLVLTLIRKCQLSADFRYSNNNFLHHISVFGQNPVKNKKKKVFKMLFCKYIFVTSALKVSFSITVEALESDLFHPSGGKMEVPKGWKCWAHIKLNLRIYCTTGHWNILYHARGSYHSLPNTSFWLRLIFIL